VNTISPSTVGSAEGGTLPSASVFAALEAGARGYLTKDAGATEIAPAIRTVHAGEALLDPSVQRRLLESLRAPGAAAPPVRVGARAWSRSHGVGAATAVRAGPVSRPARDR